MTLGEWETLILTVSWMATVLALVLGRLGVRR